MPTVNPPLAHVVLIFITRSTISVIHTSIPGHDTLATSSFKTTVFIFAMSAFFHITIRGRRNGLQILHAVSKLCGGFNKVGFLRS
jgi:hypothetical protein